MYVCMYVCMYVYVCVCMCMYVYVCVCVCMCMCVYVCVCVCVCVCMCVCVFFPTLLFYEKSAFTAALVDLTYAGSLRSENLLVRAPRSCFLSASTVGKVCRYPYQIHQLQQEAKLKVPPPFGWHRAHTMHGLQMPEKNGQGVKSN